jgi:hypothetical protein
VKIGEGAEEQIFLKVWGLFGMEELFQRGLVSLRERWLKFVAGCLKAGAPEQVPHELELAEPSPLFRTVDCHGISSTSGSISRAEVCATVEHSVMFVNAPSLV